MSEEQFYKVDAYVNALRLWVNIGGTLHDWKRNIIVYYNLTENEADEILHAYNNSSPYLKYTTHGK